MSAQVSLEAKKAFLGWFLDRYQLKRRESMWILNYLLNHDIVLNKVHFVEAADKTNRGIVMSTIGTDEEAFLFYKSGSEFDNPEQAFHEVRLNWHSDLFIELVFQDAWKSVEYLSVLEDNPFYSWNDAIPERTKKEADKALEAFLMNIQKQRILSQIDEALENDDREAFLALSKNLQTVEKSMMNGEKNPNH